MNPKLEAELSHFAQSAGRLTVLTGAGISAESGIPTFRGKEGYWTVGAKEYHPQEMATFQMFSRAPDEVWKWYLYRFNVCTSARPNPGHLALVEMERMFQERFTLITQNVDGLHLRAGNSPDRTYHIHGNCAFMRCASECGTDLYPIPETFKGRPKDQALAEAEIRLLSCPACGSRTRPRVLWFDESYNEHFFKFNSSLETARRTDLLIIVGTSGATNLPNQVVSEAGRRGALLIDINIEANPFSRFAEMNDGFFLQETGSAGLSAILDVFRAAL